MANQTIPLLASIYGETATGFQWRYLSNRPLISADLNGGNTRHFARFGVIANGQVILSFDDAASGTDDSNRDISDAFETNGSLLVTIEGHELAVSLAGADLADTYQWSPTNQAEVSAFHTAVLALPGSPSGSLVIDDNALPDASAPTVTISGVQDVDEGGTLQLTPNFTGGTYDTIGTTWAVDSGGGSVNNAGLYNAPNVGGDVSVTLSYVVTATGTGTNAADGTSDTATGTVTFTVNDVPVTLLALSDRIIPSGRVVEWSALIEAGSTRLLEGRTGQTAQGSIVDGDMEFANGTTTCIGIRRTGGPNLSLFTADTPGFDDLFGGASPSIRRRSIPFPIRFYKRIHAG